eukprot:11259679-Alexandrium_andersonii.AAC.1
MVRDFASSDPSIERFVSAKQGAEQHPLRASGTAFQAELSAPQEGVRLLPAFCLPPVSPRSSRPPAGRAAVQN